MIYSIAETTFNKEVTEVRVGKHILNVSIEHDSIESDVNFQSKELFSAAISSSICTEIKRHVVLKKWDVNFVHVNVSIFDQELNNNNTFFHCDIKLNGKLDAEQIKELKQIAAQSDVYRMLNSKIELSLDLG